MEDDEGRMEHTAEELNIIATPAEDVFIDIRHPKRRCIS